MSESPAKKRKEEGGGYSHYNQGQPPSSSPPYGHPPPRYGYHHSHPPPPAHLSHHGQPPQQQHHRQQYDGPPPHHYSKSMLYSKGPPPHSHPNHPSNYQQSSSLYSTQAWTGPPQSQPNSGNIKNDSRRSIDHVNGMIKDDGGRHGNGSGNNFDKDKSSPTSKSSPSKPMSSTGINTGGGNGYYANTWHGSSPAGGPPANRNAGGLSYNTNAPPPPIWNTSSSPPHWTDRDFSGGGRSSPRESAERNDKDDGKGGDKGRGSYKCGKVRFFSYFLYHIFLYHYSLDYCYFFLMITNVILSVEYRRKVTFVHINLNSNAVLMNHLQK